MGTRCLVIFLVSLPLSILTQCVRVLLNESSCTITPEHCEEEEVVLRESVP